MVLSERNGGKYLSNRWHEERERAHQRPEDYTDAEKEWLEIPSTEPGTHNPDRFEVDTMPIGGNPFREPRIRRYDLRDRPGAGGSD